MKRWRRERLRRAKREACQYRALRKSAGGHQVASRLMPPGGERVAEGLRAWDLWMRTMRWEEHLPRWMYWRWRRAQIVATCREELRAGTRVEKRLHPERRL